MLIRVTIRPLKAATVTTPETAKSSKIAAGKEAVFTGSPEVRLDIKGFGSIHAAGPEVELEALREEIDEADKKLTRLTQPYGTQDPDRLQSLLDQAKDLDRKIKTLEEQ